MTISSGFHRFCAVFRVFLRFFPISHGLAWFASVFLAAHLGQVCHATCVVEPCAALSIQQHCAAQARHHGLTGPITGHSLQQADAKAAT